MIRLLAVLLGCLGAAPSPRECETLRLAIEANAEEFGAGYARSGEFLARLEALRRDEAPAARERFEALRRDALLGIPPLREARLLLVRRAAPNPRDYVSLGLPTNHECNTSLPRAGYDNEIVVLESLAPGAAMTTVFRPADGGYVGEMDLHWDGERLLFTRSGEANWSIWELRLGESAAPRPVSRMPGDVDAFDACYLPGGGIVFGSTAAVQAVPCWHGLKRTSNLYRMDEDGGNVRQLCFDQDHDFHPSVLNSGQVIYNRWDYTGINHIFMRQLMAMNPDGTAQRALHGSNSWFPNALYFPRALPGDPSRLVCILSGYHGAHRMGQLVIADPSKGWLEEAGLVQRISGRGDPIDPKIKDILIDEDWPKFLHPWPIDARRFLTACWTGRNANWAIYYADVFDNLVPIREEPGQALLEPILMGPRPAPPALPERIDPGRDDAIVYLNDVHAGPGLAGVPRGEARALRVIAYDFGYPGLAGPDLIGRGGPWEAMRILGTVPLEADGSALFRIPANTPVAVQPLGSDGSALQLMRSWFAAMPGEFVSCIGCHDPPAETPAAAPALAALGQPRDIEPWRGPARGFDFEREVQPVLDRRCAGCHDGSPGRPDLRREALAEGYRGLELSQLGRDRMHPEMKRDTGGFARYTPAYEALIPYIRRVGIEDDVSLLTPGEFNADSSELIQMLRKGHQGARLNAEDWDRLIAWIDLNAPCHGTWGEVYPIPDGAHERRMELRAVYGGAVDDPEAIPDLPEPPREFTAPVSMPAAKPAAAPGWPFGAGEARRRQRALGETAMEIDLGRGVAMRLVRIPAGEFVMGDPAGAEDERPRRAAIERPFWMAAFETTNEQFRQFDPAFDCGYYGKRHARADDRGLPLDAPDQPAVRVSFEQAEAFCAWLSGRAGLEFRLPSEAEWEYACRAGSAAPLAFGGLEADFSPWANLGDAFFFGETQITGGLEHLAKEGAALADRRFADGSVATAAVGRYRPNAWGLHDMHGNAAEWARGAGAEAPQAVARGGSFFDRPARARAAIRIEYPRWRRVFNVGFRVVGEGQE